MDWKLCQSDKTYWLMHYNMVWCQFRNSQTETHRDSIVSLLFPFSRITAASQHSVIGICVTKSSLDGLVTEVCVIEGYVESMQLATSIRSRSPRLQLDMGKSPPQRGLLSRKIKDCSQKTVPQALLSHVFYWYSGIVFWCFVYFRFGFPCLPLIYRATPCQFTRPWSWIAVLDLFAFFLSPVANLCLLLTCAWL